MDMSAQSNNAMQIKIESKAKEVNTPNPNEAQVIKNKIIDKLLKWFLFSVIGALLPLGATLADAMMDSTKSTELWNSVCKGNLLLISIGINCAVMGELSGIGTVKLKRLKIVSNALGILLYILQVMIYNMLTTIKTDNLNKSIIQWLSIIFFICTLGLSISNLVLGEVE